MYRSVQVIESDRIGIESSARESGGAMSEDEDGWMDGCKTRVKTDNAEFHTIASLPHPIPPTPAMPCP
jgi:hypothetical protein